MTDRTTNNITKIDLINAKNSVAFKDVPAEEIIPIHGAAIATDPDDGKQYAYIWTPYGDCYAGNSQSVMEQVIMIIDLLDDGQKLNFSVVKRQSKQGKEFLSLKLTTD